MINNKTITINSVDRFFFAEFALRPKLLLLKKYTYLTSYYVEL